MKAFSLLKNALAALLLLLASGTAFAQFRVIGYVPSWAGSVNDVQYSKLTHINYAFLLPTATGGLQAIENPSKLQSLVSLAHANQVKVLISVGGWNNGDDSAFESIGANAGYRNAFVANLVNFANQYGLDGVDIDWEYPDAGASATNYAALMQQLATEMHNRGKLLTAAVVATGGVGVPNSVFGNVDFLNLMAYDANNFDHSTYNYAVESINYWRGRGLPASKTVLGVPFYGRPSWESYAQLLARGASPNADVFNGVGYNGIPTIKSKTNLAFDQGSGIMIWELSQDATGANSLLTAINQVVVSRTGTPPPPTGVATVYRDCNYTGTATNLPVGNYNLAALQSRGILNEDISSLKVNSGYQVVLYENDNFSGTALTVTTGNGCLVGNALGTGNWNDKTTSLRVQTATSTPSFSRQLEAEAANTNSGMTAEACSEGGQNMGYVDAGDYLVFTGINFPTTGTYLIEYRVASLSGGTISSDLNAGSIQLGSTAIPATGGWQSWTTVSRNVTINAGTYNFGVFAQTGGWNLNWVRISKPATSARTAAPDASLTDGAKTLEAYPSPVTDRLFFRAAQALAGSKYQIFDSWGQPVASGSAAAGSVEVSALKPGIYTLVVSTSEQQKLVSRFSKE